ncbi:hypothetical protein TRAPUB_10028 [Trametes pubescens]|uniref:Uncharacterized protein n=1 Tax=Trametes pubescens TaxID=154538 RepID=A0A1M2W0X5_TRAPU|nr:hypothetical protein TRAPUB_10028 [Trametes pubescens]
MKQGSYSQTQTPAGARGQDEKSVLEPGVHGRCVREPLEPISNSASYTPPRTAATPPSYQPRPDRLLVLPPSPFYLVFSLTLFTTSI